MNGTICGLTNQPREIEVWSNKVTEFFVRFLDFLWREKYVFRFLLIFFLILVFRWDLSARSQEQWLVQLQSYPLASMHLLFNALCSANTREALSLSLSLSTLSAKIRILILIYVTDCACWKDQRSKTWLSAELGTVCKTWLNTSCYPFFSIDDKSHKTTKHWAINLMVNEQEFWRAAKSTG